MNKDRRRNDLLLIIGLLLIAAVCGGILFFQRMKEKQDREDGAGALREAVVSLDGNKVLRLRLSEKTGAVPEVLQMDETYVRQDGEEDGAVLFSVYQNGVAGDADGVNRLSVRDGQIACVYADCPDQICVKHGYIGLQTETIVCLPHRMIVTVLAEGED